MKYSNCFTSDYSRDSFEQLSEKARKIKSNNNNFKSKKRNARDLRENIYFIDSNHFQNKLVKIANIKINGLINKLIEPEWSSSGRS